MTKSNDYKVGYRRPPKHSRFKKGKSGNPKGRPSQDDDGFVVLLDKHLKKRVQVNVNGVKQVISMREAIVQQLVTKAGSGDRKAIEYLIALLQKMSATDMKPVIHFTISETDSKL